MSSVPVLEKTHSASSGAPDSPGLDGDVEKSPKPTKALVPPDARPERENRGDASDDESDDAESIDRSQIPWRYKWSAFAMIILFAFGRCVGLS
jgi:hypothetical protein